jgi:hypothetical protein
MNPILPDYGLTQVVEAGASWINTAGLSWPSVEPTEGARNWSAIPYNGKQLWTIWSADGSTRTVSLATMPAAVYDMMGKPVAVSASRRFTLTAPNTLFAYVEW